FDADAAPARPDPAARLEPCPGDAGGAIGPANGAAFAALVPESVMNSDNVAGDDAACAPSGASSDAEQAAARERVLQGLRGALCDGAIPGELDNFSAEDCAAAAEFVATCAARRPAGIALVRLEPLGTKVGER